MNSLINLINLIFFRLKFSNDRYQRKKNKKINIQKIILLIGGISKVILRLSSPFLEKLPFESRSILNINNLKFKN